jgi:hypothetical protein
MLGQVSFAAAALAEEPFGFVPLIAVAGVPEESVGVVDTTAGKWYLRDPFNGETTSFFFGNPADMGMTT